MAKTPVKKTKEPSVEELEKKLLERRLKKENEVIEYLHKYLQENNCVLEADVDVVINGKPVGVRVRAL